jgi:hypothetical protein
MNFNVGKDIIIIKKMYYDEYDKLYGDGFYPKLTPDGIGICSCKTALISFKLIKYPSEPEFVWIQNDGSVIYGFDRNYGIQLLHSLNQEAKVDAKRILNSAGRIIYPVIYQFSTYRVISQNM